MTTHVERFGLPPLDPDEAAFFREHLRGKDPAVLGAEIGISGKSVLRAAAEAGLSTGSRTLVRLALRRWGFQR